MKKTLTVVILTYNESIHIERAIRNVLGWADHVMVLDSYSEDDTVEKAQTLGAEVILRKFDHYKNQRQYAIDYCKAQTKWMFFLDADEYLTDALKEEIQEAIKKQDTAGYYASVRLIFMNRWIKHGGYYPSYLMRLFRPDRAEVKREINEHVTILGTVAYLKNDFITL